MFISIVGRFYHFLAFGRADFLLVLELSGLDEDYFTDIYTVFAAVCFSSLLVSAPGNYEGGPGPASIKKLTQLNEVIPR